LQKRLLALADNSNKAIACRDLAVLCVVSATLRTVLQDSRRSHSRGSALTSMATYAEKVLLCCLLFDACCPLLLVVLGHACSDSWGLTGYCDCAREDRVRSARLLSITD
jgi:hypothetical protein